LSLASSPGKTYCPYDVSGWTGVSFWVKGSTTTGKLRFQLPTVETQAGAQGGTCKADCGDHFGADFVLGPDWTNVKIPFASLRQAGTGATFTRDLQHALNIEF